jgi:transposase
MGYRIPGGTVQCLAKALTRKNVPEELLAIVAPLVATGLELDEKIVALDKDIKTVNEEYPEAKLLQAIPGVGPLISLAYILCIENPGRFTKSRRVGGYLGLRPSMRVSALKSRFGGITHAGDAEMRRLLVQAAHGCLRSRQDTDLKRWGLQLAARAGKQIAVVGLARKMAVVMHHIWVTGEAFRPLGSPNPKVV